MIAVVLRKELRAILRDGRFPVLALCAAALLVAVVIASGHVHRRVEAEKAQVAAIVREQWDNQGDKHPHRGAHYGLYAFQPDAPLARIDPGIAAYVGHAIWLEPHRRNMPRFQPAADALPSARWGELTPAFVLVALLPLLLIGLGFQSVAQEHESGTLRMLHGTRFRAPALLAGKLAALLLVFGGVVVAAVVLALAFSPPATTAGGWRSATLAGSLALYYTCIAAIVLFVSAVVRRGTGALYALLAIWVCFTLVTPRLASGVAGLVVPLPTAEQFWAAIHHDYTQGLPGDGDLATRGSRFDAELLARHGVSRLGDLPVGAMPLRRLARDQYADRVHALHFSRLWQAFERQQAIVRWMSLLSPALAMRNVSRTLAGTDLAHQRHFEEAAENYRQRINREIDEWDATHTRGVTSFESKYADDALWRSVGAFAYQPPPAGFALKAAAPDLMILLAWVAMSLVLLRRAAARLMP
ncbi:MAG TPA: DUF3526 domain-containing protein [Ramlibacter sp.]|nr:DUF3526 domain-containing protein [Ramlibacter sp.]